MANTIKTLSDGDITRKALSILHNELVFTKTINRQYDDRFARSGAKNGGSLLIREPNQFSVRTGAVMDTQDVTESTQTLTLATQMGVDINYSSVELTLSLDDFADRILKPAMARLAAEVDKTVINACYPYVYKYQQTTQGTQPNHLDVLQARAKLQQGLAPTSDRHLMSDSLGASGIITSAVTHFNPASEISRQYTTGMIGNIYGFKFWESEMTPTYTSGTATDATPTVYTTLTGTSIENGADHITVTAASTGTTIKAGAVCIITGLYACNPETKTTCAWLQQWAIVEDVAATTVATDFKVSPIPYKSGPKQNFITVTGTTSAALILTGTTAFSSKTTGTISTGTVHSLAYHKDAFTAVFADLEMPSGVPGMHREVYDGISMRFWRGSDIINDKFPVRLDVLFGQKTIRPAWAVRIGA